MKLRKPSLADWEEIAKGFWHRWNFFLCLGALDGKHVIMKVPKKSGSMFFNYKGTFSLVLMALADHDYRFIYVDISDYGSNSDGGVWKHSSFGKAYENGQLNTPLQNTFPTIPRLAQCTIAL